MASRLLVPFDYNPVSTEIKTGNYTVPSGKYARLTAGTQIPSSVNSTLSSSGTGTATQTYQTAVFKLNTSSLILPPSFSVSSTQPSASNTVQINFSSNIDLSGIFRFTVTAAGGGNAKTFAINVSGVWTTIFTTTGNSFSNSVYAHYSNVSGIRVVHGGLGGSGGVSGYFEAVKQNDGIDIWLKSGDVIENNCTQYVITEYNVIS